MPSPPDERQELRREFAELRRELERYQLELRRLPRGAASRREWLEWHSRRVMLRIESVADRLRELEKDPTG